MSLTLLDPRTALVVIDLQKGLMAALTVRPIAGVVAHAAALADAFRRRGLPVVLVNTNGARPGRTEQPRRSGDLSAEMIELIPELNHQPSDHAVTKQSWGAFTDTNLEQYLRSQDVTQVVLAGMATSIGVESTARQAHELGLNVTLAVDAMTDMNADAHANSVERIFPRLGETGTTQEVLDMLNAHA